MKLLLDENLGVRVPQFLRKNGFDVTSATEILRGRPDLEILKAANRQRRILVTSDKDFGELVYKEGLAHKGVILLRLRNESVENKKKVLLRLLQEKKKLEGRFTVIRG